MKNHNGEMRPSRLLLPGREPNQNSKALAAAHKARDDVAEYIFQIYLQSDNKDIAQT